MAVTSAIFGSIQAVTAALRYNISRHARLRMEEEHLVSVDVEHAIARGEVVEDYPDDWPFPSCLIYGPDPSGDPVHVVVAYDAGSGYAVWVTAYRPDPAAWIDFRERRR